MSDTTLTGEQIGSVISLNGSVWAVSGTSQRPLTEGAPVYEGEEIVTESDSNVEIKFVDNTILGQGEDSAVQLDDYAYSEDANQLDFHMVKGVMRVVSGEIVKINPEAFNLSTPLATIGIRGTQVMVQVDEGREFIGVDELGEGHTVLIANAFNEIVIDRAGMFSGVDFDGSLIAPDEMPTTFISTITRAAPLTSIGDAPRNPGESQDISPPSSFETIGNQSGEFQPGVGVEVAEEDGEGEQEYEGEEDEEGEEEYEEEFELTEAEIEALLELETAGGTEAGGETEEFDELTDVNYDPFANQTSSNQGQGAGQGQGQGQGQDNNPVEGQGDDDTQVEDDPEDAPPPVEDVVVDQGDAEENAPVSFNVIGEGEDVTLVEAEVTIESEHEGEVVFEPEGTITYTPDPGEDGTVVIDFTVEDPDGEETSAQLSFELADDSEPVITVTDAIGEESEGVVSASGIIDVDFGADSEGSSIELSADGATWYDGGSLTALDGSWVINLTDDGYEYTQYGALADAGDTAPGEELSIDVTVTATDGDGSVTTGDLTVTVTDDGPTASDVTFDQGAEDSNVSYNVLSGGDATAGLYDGELTNATLAEGSRAPGSVSYDELGNITYDPVPGETGTILIDYTVTDADGDTASAQIAFTLNADSAPVITVSDATGEVDDGIMTASGSIGVDFGADSAGTTIALSADDATWHSQTGTLLADDSSWAIELNDDGYEYTQFAQLADAVTTDAGENLAVDVTVTATDGDGSVTTGDFTVTVSDDGPTAGDATVSQEIEDSDVSYNVLTDDATTGMYVGGTLDNAALAEGSTAPGSVSYDGLGNITYDPVPGETGTVLIDYTVTDSDGDEASAQLSITLATDSAPEIEVSGASGSEAGGLATATGTIDVDFGADSEVSIELASDVADWDSETATLTAEDDSWDIQLTDDGYVFTQYEAFDHSEGDEYAIDVEVTATDDDGSISTGDFSVLVSDDGPEATDAYMVQEDVEDTISYNVFDEDSATTGTDGGYLVAAELSEGSAYDGDVEFNEEGTITYTPADGETGTVTIDYLVEDGDGDTATAQLSIDLAEPEEEPGEEPVNLLVNGDFSDITAHVGNTWVAANDTSVDGWDAGRFYNSNSESPHNAKPGTGNSKIEVWKAGYKGVLSSDGSREGYFVEVDYAGATDFIAQTVTTTIGAAYLMTFEATIRPDSPEGETLIAQVWSDGNLIAEEVYTPDRYDTNAQNGWNQFTLEFIADSEDTTVMFTEPQFNDEGNAKNTYGVLLDNVTLTVDSDYDGEVIPGDGEGLVLLGTDDDDEIFGTHGNDSITSYAGDDEIFGDMGDDTIDSGEGDDYVEVEGGDNVIKTGEGDDYVYAMDGNNVIETGEGDDEVEVEWGDNTIKTGEGDDYVYAMGGDNVIETGEGDDEVEVEWGDNIIKTGEGDDYVYAMDGDNVIETGAGDDEVYGGEGNDVIIGGAGQDELYGGNGNDTFVFTSPEDGTDSILDFNTAHDQIAMYEATFDLLSDGNGSLNENQFTVVEDSTYSGGYDFEGATSGLIYASDEGSNVGALFYDPNDTISGDETLLGTVTEDDDNNITAADIDII